MTLRLGWPVTLRPGLLGVLVLLLAVRAQDGAYALVGLVTVPLALLLHELGHAAALARLGGRPAIELDLLGGRTRLVSGRPPEPRERVAVALAGPLAGALVAAIGFVLVRVLPGSAPPLLRLGLLDLVAASGLWAAVSLLPIWTLDGAEVLEAALSPRLGARASRVVLCVSVFVSGLAVVGAASLGRVWAALLAFALGARAVAALRVTWGRGEDAAQEDRVREGWRHLERDERHEARTAAEQALAAATHPAVRRAAVELLAWTELRSDDAPAALAALERAAEPERIDPGLRGRVLLRVEGRAAEAASLLERAAGQAAGPDLVRDWLAALLESEDWDGVVTLIGGAHGRSLGEARLADAASTLFFGGRYEAARRVAGLRHERFGSADAAYDAACAAARLAEPEEAVRWLERAVSAGFRDVEHLAQDEDLEGARAHEGFARLLERLGGEAPRREGGAPS
jgi:Zn-dependent protease